MNPFGQPLDFRRVHALIQLGDHRVDFLRQGFAVVLPSGMLLKACPLIVVLGEFIFKCNEVLIPDRLTEPADTGTGHKTVGGHVINIEPRQFMIVLEKIFSENEIGISLIVFIQHVKQGVQQTEPIDLHT